MIEQKKKRNSISTFIYISVTLFTPVCLKIDNNCQTYLPDIISLLKCKDLLTWTRSIILFVICTVIFASFTSLLLSNEISAE